MSIIISVQIKKYIFRFFATNKRLNEIKLTALFTR